MLTNEMILDVHDALSCGSSCSVAGAPRSSRQGTHKVLSGYSRGTLRVLTRYFQGTRDILTQRVGTHGGTPEHLRQLARRRRRAEERAEHL
jgi:hypothetical protein